MTDKTYKLLKKLDKDDINVIRGVANDCGSDFAMGFTENLLRLKRAEEEVVGSLTGSDIDELVGILIFGGGFSFLIILISLIL